MAVRLIRHVAFEGRWVVGLWRQTLGRKLDEGVFGPLYCCLPYVRRWSRLSAEAMACTNPEDFPHTKLEEIAGGLLLKLGMWFLEM